MMGGSMNVLWSSGFGSAGRGRLLRLRPVFISLMNWACERRVWARPAIDAFLAIARSESRWGSEEAVRMWFGTREAPEDRSETSRCRMFISDANDSVWGMLSESRELRGTGGKGGEGGVGSGGSAMLGVMVYRAVS